jgi:hypothetical protein
LFSLFAAWFPGSATLFQLSLFPAKAYPPAQEDFPDRNYPENLSVFNAQMIIC